MHPAKPLIESIARALEYERRSTLALARDIPDHAADARPAGLAQIPAWIVPHLALADTRQLAAVTARPLDEGDDAFFADFGPGTHAGPVRACLAARFGSWSGALDAAAASHAKLVAAVRAADPDTLLAPHPAEQTRAYFPTIADNLVYACWHEGDHGGQLRAWVHAARAEGLLPPAS